jgi:hypothetical protein
LTKLFPLVNQLESMQSSEGKRRLSKKWIALIVIIIVDLVLSGSLLAINYNASDNKTTNFFFGVEVAYGDYNDLKAVVTEVKNYTNLVVLGLPEVSINRDLLDQSCDYIYSQDLYFMVLFTNTSQYSGWQNYTPAQWVQDAKAKYGDKFLAVYRWDEPGGDQLDSSPYKLVESASSYSDAAQQYVNVLKPEVEYYQNTGVDVVTADYGLYWFDYEAGYDTVLAEFGWNNSRSMQIALARGAAQAHNKTWGAMITWTYTDPPYIESGARLLEDLVLAYNNGAKYVIVFNYPEVSTAKYGLLGQEHLAAMKQFWNYSSTYGPSGKDIETAYVLPEDYGFGLRSSQDTIWGLWSADASTSKIYSDVNMLIQLKGAEFNILINNATLAKDVKGHYTELIYWNGNRVNP